MSMNVLEQVGEHRAAVLLGLPMTEIRRFSRISGLGHMEEGDRGEQVVFTYEEGPSSLARLPNLKLTREDYFSLSFNFPAALFSSRNARSCGAVSSNRIHCS